MPAKIFDIIPLYLKVMTPSSNCTPDIFKRGHSIARRKSTAKGVSNDLLSVVMDKSLEVCPSGFPVTSSLPLGPSESCPPPTLPTISTSNSSDQREFLSIVLKPSEHLSMANEEEFLGNDLTLGGIFPSPELDEEEGVNKPDWAYPDNTYDGGQAARSAREDQWGRVFAAIRPRACNGLATNALDLLPPIEEIVDKPASSTCYQTVSSGIEEKTDKGTEQGLKQVVSLCMASIRKGKPVVVWAGTRSKSWRIE